MTSKHLIGRGQHHKRHPSFWPLRHSQTYHPWWGNIRVWKDIQPVTSPFLLPFTTSYCLFPSSFSSFLTHSFHSFTYPSFSSSSSPPPPSFSSILSTSKSSSPPAVFFSHPPPVNPSSHSSLCPPSPPPHPHNSEVKAHTLTLMWRAEMARRLMRDRRGRVRLSEEWQQHRGPSSSQRYRITTAQQDEIFTQKVDQLPWVKVVSRTAVS